MVLCYCDIVYAAAYRVITMKSARLLTAADDATCWCDGAVAWCCDYIAISLLLSRSSTKSDNRVEHNSICSPSSWERIDAKRAKCDASWDYICICIYGRPIFIGGSAYTVSQKGATELSHVAPTIRIDFPLQLCPPVTLQHFKRSLKAELYNRAFDCKWFVTSRMHLRFILHYSEWLPVAYYSAL